MAFSFASAPVREEHRRLVEPQRRLGSVRGEVDVHRHTPRHRVSVIERLLGLDLSQFADRAELWAALQLADRSTGTSA